MPEPPSPLVNCALKYPKIIIAAALLLAALTIWRVAGFTEQRGLEGLRRTGEARIALHTASLLDTLEKYRHIPYILARDTRIRGLLKGDLAAVHVNPHLDDFARAAETLIFVMDNTGRTVATSNWRTAESLMDINFAFRPYFQDALLGNSGSYYAVGVKTRKPGFFISNPVLEAGRLLGVVVVKVDLGKLQEDWRESGETLIVSDAGGVLFLSSRPEWQYRSLRPLPEETVNRLRKVQYLDRPLTPLALTRQTAIGGNIMQLEGDSFFEQSRQLLDYGWRIHYLSDLAPIAAGVRLAMAVTAVVFMTLLLVLLYLRERRQKLQSRREAREAQAVGQLNERLKEEIAQHKETVNTLRITQAELIQAGKLAALGRMSAAIAHELNQPVTAIRTFIASCRIFLDRRQPDKVAENLLYIDRLTERMAGITGQLKTFARKSKGRRTPVDVRVVIEHVLAFFTPQFEQQGVALACDLPERGVAMVLADALQFEQVLNNLLRNSLDAMKNSSRKNLRISLTTTEDSAILCCRDSGEGITAEAEAMLFDPFFTTKEIGRGLGLGLSISYGIIREMSGTIKAENHPEGGALFTLHLPLTSIFPATENPGTPGS